MTNDRTGIARKPNVLFLCTGNSCRSQMAEALLRRRYGDLFNAYHAGSDPTGIHPLAIEVLEEIGVDTSDLRSKSVKEYLGRLRAHYLVIVCQRAQEDCPRLFPGLVERFFWDIDDPPAFEGSATDVLRRFRAARDEITAAIDRWVGDLKACGSLDGILGKNRG